MRKFLWATISVALISMAFVACDKDDDESNSRKVVDLGLPSGTLWATCNVGADNPWDYGDNFAWGETETKANFGWETYKYCDGTDSTLTKYCNKEECGKDGYTDKLTALEAADDAATAYWGSDFFTPTVDDWYELIYQCVWIMTDNYDNHNVSGFIVYKAKSDDHKGHFIKINDSDRYTDYSLSDAHIFIPSELTISRDLIDIIGGPLDTDYFNTKYWSSSLFTIDPTCAIIFGSGDMEFSSRGQGFPIRPARLK